MLNLRWVLVYLSMDVVVLLVILFVLCCKNSKFLVLFLFSVENLLFVILKYSN